MANGKTWAKEEEIELKKLAEANTHIDIITVKLGRTRGAVYEKCRRLGYSLKPNGYIDTFLSMPRELPSVEEGLQMLAGALKMAVKPGLDRVEVQRLQAVASISKTYKEYLADYINYRDIEAKLQKMEELVAKLQRERTSNNACPQDSPPVA